MLITNVKSKTFMFTVVTDKENVNKSLDILVDTQHQRIATFINSYGFGIDDLVVEEGVENTPYPAGDLIVLSVVSKVFFIDRKNLWKAESTQSS